MSATKKIEGKVRFLSVPMSRGSLEFYCDAAAMKLVGEMIGRGDADRELMLNAFATKSVGYVENRIARALEADESEVHDEFSVKRDDALLVFVLNTRDGRVFLPRFRPVSNTSEFYPVEGGRRLMQQGVDRIVEKVGIGEDRLVHRIYELAIERSGAKMPEPEPVPEKGEPQGEPQVVERVTERVIERDVPNPLEQMLQKSLMDTMAKVAVDDMVPKIKQRLVEEFGFEPQFHEVKLADGRQHKFDGIVHESFDAVMHAAYNDIPAMLVGPAGAGKGVLARQVAKALGLPFYCMNSVTDEYKFTGFIDANGNYHETEFYKAFKNGGLFFLDEMDASAPEVLVCLNMALADRIFPFPHETVVAHEDFRVVAACNTLGTGADASYTGRMQLDAASLNRFVVISVGYDERIDLVSADGDEKLVEFAKQYRRSLKECGLTGVCSYRNLKMIKSMAAAFPLEQALAMALTKEMNKDDINTMLGRGVLDQGNPYTKALKNVESLAW